MSVLAFPPAMPATPAWQVTPALQPESNPMIEQLRHLQNNTPVLIVLAVVLLFFALFLGYYFARAVRLWRALHVAEKGVSRTPVDPAVDLAPAFDHDRRLSHLWSEYFHTLHPQEELDFGSGMLRVVARRSTVPAETFFSGATVVDGRIGVEFFRHLPGVFTGLGIIGTFIGLIDGLRKFRLRSGPDNTIDPSAAVSSLETLINGVGEAFLISALAIILAMLVTVLEKWLLQRLYLRVETLARLIDERYQFGAGEEYLARLTRAAEESATQSKILKDALVGELRDILTTLTDRQVAAVEVSHRSLQSTFEAQITQGLKSPLDQIAAGFADQRSQQGQQMTQMLGDLLATFTDRLQNLFGGQIEGINDMQRKTVDALTAAMQRFEQLAANMEASGSRAGDAMAAQLAKSIDAMEARQESINASMSAFVAEMKRSMGESQSETATATSRLVAELTTGMQSLVQRFEELGQRASDDMAGRQTALSEQAKNGLDQLAATITEQVSAMTVNIQTMVAALQEQAARAETDHAGRQQTLADQARAGVESVGAAISGRLDALSDGMQRAVQQLDEAGRRAVDDARTRQSTLEEQSRIGMEQMTAAVKEQVATSARQIESLVRSVQELNDRAAADHTTRQQALAEQASLGMKALADAISAQQLVIRSATEAMRAAIGELQSITTRAIDGMSRGADTMQLAATRFTDAGNAITGTLDGATRLGRTLEETGANTLAASRALEGLLGDYRSAREGVVALIAQLVEKVDQAKRETGLTDEILRTIERASQSLSQAGTDADQYLGKVVTVLTESHGTFSSGLVKAINEANKAYQTELSTAVGRLKEVVEELDSVLDDAVTAASRSR